MVLLEIMILFRTTLHLAKLYPNLSYVHDIVFLFLFQYLSLLESYQSREDHCDVLLKWLIAEANVSPEERSHWILETLLYKVALATNCGR